ncbi:DUF3298 and DUF4163 domain-containing protein [Flavobacterium pallidum]|uniref:DUF3298/DUF4163 domain-containing protein n=1 Tax=Flavobacterium pallidum TaxID=2172098 RepID=A0A2S1SEX7_9FLAO|nr:DUF3298 and DUF4163 domain-containing protein [Flavobacterium pallidum]AWI24951.1 DUF3298/DUF4163 domain-containing protein [Flavobacterium pallidum]
MKKMGFLLMLLLLASCNNELSFEQKSFAQKSSLPCKSECTQVSVNIPLAKDKPIVADSINKKVFSTMKEILMVGENQFTDTEYKGLLNSFIKAYDKMQTENPTDEFNWEAKITGKVLYQSDSIINIELKHYKFTGGAHGYSGRTSLIFDPETGKSIPNEYLFKDRNGFKDFAEKKFRAAYKIPDGPINSTNLMFEDEEFQLPQTYFFTEKGLLLFYNVYEIASYADGPKELLIPYKEANPYLAVK